MAPVDSTAALPTELINLLTLHSSFLTALSLHYIHNGTSSPVDLRDLTEATTSIWRHRKVTYDDIRLCIGVLAYGPSGKNNPFQLSDYGRGKICLEIIEQHQIGLGMSAMTEEALKLMFMESLDYLWRQWTTTQTAQPLRPIATPKKRGRPKKIVPKQTTIQAYVDEPSITKFIEQLPCAEITQSESLTAIVPLQEKGRKRLREFKESVQQGRAPKKTKESMGKENDPTQMNMQPAQAQAQTKMTDFTAVRKSNLLDRILAKEAAAATGPKALSPAEIQRKAALQRSEEVLRVLSLLCASKGPSLRVSFSMNALLQSLQNSVRTPISKEEALKCIEVLANEVTPGYVSLVRMGTLSSIVINQGMKPHDVKNRLVTLGAY